MTVDPKKVIPDIYSGIEGLRVKGFETGCIGRTPLGFPVSYVKKGDEKYGKAMIFGAIHAREYITAPLVLKMAEEYEGKSAVYFVPLVNPDGVLLVTGGAEAAGYVFENAKPVDSADCCAENRPATRSRRPENRYPSVPVSILENGGCKTFDAYAAFLEIYQNSERISGEKNALSSWLVGINGGSRDFSLWKANIDAVDLNVNFDADWGTGLQNLTYPAPANFIGPYPESEPETKALVSFTKRHDFLVVLCYHCKGEVIYYGYKNNQPYPEYAKLYSSLTGYPLSGSPGSTGGYKDWFTQQYDRLSLTIEVGREEYAYGELNSMFDRIYEQNADVPSLTDFVCRKLLKTGR